jgi:hypothetical protein
MALSIILSANAVYIAFSLQYTNSVVAAVKFALFFQLISALLLKLLFVFSISWSKVPKVLFLSMKTGETRQGWPLLAVQPEVNENSKSKNDRGPS